MGIRRHLCIPCQSGAVTIPLTDRVKYLGVLVSFRNCSNLTVDHRLKAAKMSFNRMRVWLTSRHFNLKYRLQLWRSCVWSVVHYGLIGADITLSGLQKLQHEGIQMLRQIVRDHSFYTHHTHSSALQPYVDFWPLHLLRTAVERFQSNHRSRLALLDATDVVTHATWTHLDGLLSRIDTAEQNGPLGLSLSMSPPGPPAPQTQTHQCQLCHPTYHD